MSDVETVALIGFFLVLSAIVVWLVGGDADRALAEQAARRTAGADGDPAPRRVSVTQSEKASETAAPAAKLQPTSAPVAVRDESPKASASTVQPVEASMVKIDLPPPTPIPNATIAPAPARVAQPIVAPTAPVRPAAPLPQPVAQSAAATSPAPARTVQAAPTQPAPAQVIVRPPTAQSAPAPVVSRPVAAPPVAAPAAPQQASTPAPAAVKPASAASNTPGLARPDARATLQPGAPSTSAAVTASAHTPSQLNLSPEDQSIVSRYLRPDVKATLYRAPPPGATSPPAPGRPAPTPEAALPPAPRAAPPVAPAGPLVISKPSAQGTLAPGYQAPAPVAVAKPVGPSTGFAPLGVRPDATATQASYVAQPAVQPQAAPPPAKDAASAPSPRAALAATLPPSSATSGQSAAPARSPVPAQPQAPSPQLSSASPDPTLLSTAKRGTRVIGADAGEMAVLELERAAVARPQTPSIWSNTVQRRTVSDSELLEAELTAVPQGIRAERVPVRAETLLVRPDASHTIDPSAPKYTSIPKPPPVTNARIEARPLPDGGTLANVRFTLPPGALGDA